MTAKSAIVVIVKDVSDEFIMIVVAILFGTYCFIGGLGTTFYISYFNTALTFICLLVFWIGISYTENGNSFTESDNTYLELACMRTLDATENMESSILTFRSAAMFGLVMLLSGMSITFCDQANWQSRIAAKPTQGVIGFFIAALVYFTIPMAIALPTTFGYLSMSYKNNGTQLLSKDQIYNGNVFLEVVSCFICGR